MNGIPSDPFREEIAKPFDRRVRVLGCDFHVLSNDSRLIALVDEAFAHPASYSTNSSSPELTIDLLWHAEGGELNYETPPPLRFSSGGNCIVATFDATNFAVITTQQKSALVCASEAMYRHPYQLRYELIEFTFITLATRVRNLVPLHAACVSDGARGLLLNGVSGTGKSTLTLACIDQGLSCVADDAVFVQADQMLARGYSRFVHPGEDSVRFIRDRALADYIRSAPRIRRRSGARKLEVDLMGDTLRPELGPVTVSALVMLSPEPAQTNNPLQSLAFDEIRPVLERDQGYASGRPEWSTFIRAARRLPCYRLFRPEHPDQAAKALRTLLDPVEQ